MLVICLDIGEGENLEVELYNEGMELFHSGTITETDIAVTVRTAYHGDAQTYFMKVFSDDGTIHEYDLHPLRWPTWSQGFTYYETEPNSSTGTSDDISIDYDPDLDENNYTGVKESGDSMDWYKLQTPSDGILLIHAADFDNAPNEEEYFTLYDSSLAQLETGTIWYQDGSIILSSGGVVATGTYYVKLQANTWTHRYVIEPELIVE